MFQMRTILTVFFSLALGYWMGNTITEKTITESQSSKDFSDSFSKLEDSFENPNNRNKLYEDGVRALNVKAEEEKNKEEVIGDLGTALSLQKAYNQIAENSSKAVVSIRVVSEFRDDQSSYVNPLEEWLRQFSDQFGSRQSPYDRPRKVESSGSGFLINKEGFLLSNFHVVENAVEIKVTFQENGDEYEAEIVGTDPDTDIALLKVTFDDDKKDLPYLKLGDSDKVNVGDIVVAIGSPFGLPQTLTTGVISGKGRSGIVGNRIENFIQSDVAINQGNSGGPLIDLRGNVIGINSAILSRGGGSIGISFSIPINMAKNIVEQLKSNGKVERGWLGVSYEPLTSELAKALNAPVGGVLINKVFDGSPADKGEIEAGDILIAFNGNSLKSGVDLRNNVLNTPVGKTVKIKLIREGETMEVDVKIEKRETDTGDSRYQSRKVPSQELSKEYYGIQVSPMTEQQLELYSKDIPFGVTVSQLSPDSPFRENGGKQGDIILSINQFRIKTVEDFEKVMESVKSGSKFVVKFQRADSVYYLVFRS